MPAILDPADHARWLGEEPASGEELQARIRPYPADRMKSYPIGPRVSNVRNADSGLVEPLSVGAVPLQGSTMTAGENQRHPGIAQRAEDLAEDNGRGDDPSGSSRPGARD